MGLFHQTNSPETMRDGSAMWGNNCLQLTGPSSPPIKWSVEPGQLVEGEKWESESDNKHCGGCRSDGNYAYYYERTFHSTERL
jgi:hypothetical protein